MSGNSTGGKLAAKKIKTLYGSDFFARIGSAGGRKSKGGGFTNPEVARRAGKIGGAKSRRGKAKISNS